MTANLDPEQSTMLVTLKTRLLDRRATSPLLDDPTVEDAVARLPFDLDGLRVEQDLVAVCVMRAAVIDRWCAEFLRTYPGATVVHLACGLDARAARLAVPSTVHWYDVDLPPVIDLYTQVYGSTPQRQPIAASATDDGWMEQIVTPDPTLVVAEGLTMYLGQQEGLDLLRGLALRFPGGTIILDVLSRSVVGNPAANPIVRETGARMHWGVDDPSELSSPCGLTLEARADYGMLDRPEVMAGLSEPLRTMIVEGRSTPAQLRGGQIFRFRFPGPATLPVANVNP